MYFLMSGVSIGVFLNDLVLYPFKYINRVDYDISDIYCIKKQ